MKPGYKTTEFWLSILVVVLCVVMGSGLVIGVPVIAKVISLGLAVLAQLGYTKQRSLVKLGLEEGKE